MAGLGAAIWLLGLLAAAPALRSADRYALPDRLRDALVLGAAIPFGLGLFNLLYPPACWAALALCVAIAYRRRGAFARSDPRQTLPEQVPYLLIAALGLVAWPQLTRPLLDGDSLSYHLPNAAAWVHAHGLWTTDPRYWWYPPASELFVAGTFAVSGPLLLAWCGFGPLALVGFRIAAWARTEFAATPWVADALAAATVTAAPLAFQAGSAQNDVWLAAFFCEALWTIRHQPTAAARTVALTALIKPYGWVFALTALLAANARRAAWFAGAGALALWAAHDALLWHAAIVPPLSLSAAGVWQSTIASHGLPAIALLGVVALRASPFALLALLAATAGPIVARGPQRRLGWAALAASAFFLTMPRAYADAIPQLASGASLRYAAPAIVLGALLLARAAARAPRVAYALLAGSAAFGAAEVLAVFWNDAPTRAAIAVALLALGLVAAARVVRSPWPVAAGIAFAIGASWWLVARIPLSYYTDALRVGGKPSGVYAWIARTQPRTVGGSGLAIGVVNVLAPAARTLDLPDQSRCSAARSQQALLIAVAENRRTAAFNARRLNDARACGRVRYDDGIAVVAGF